MPVIASLLLFSLFQAPPPTHLQIELVFVGAMPPNVEEIAVEEATSIWAPYNVDFHVVTPDVVPDGGLRLAVVLARQRDRQLPATTLGSIRFRNGMPEPTILMQVDAIDAMVTATPQGGDRDCFPAVHNLMVGRVFGRALAHEIGHYLLRSRGHAPAGLMRATLRSVDLMADQRQGFDLTAGELTVIAGVIASAHE